MQNFQQDIFNNPKLKGKILIIKDDQIVDIKDNYKDAIKISKNRDDMALFKVPKNIDKIRILSLKIRSFKKHPWIPLYPVKYYTDHENFIRKDALIDSGADISTINYDFGLELGFKKARHDYTLTAEGIGGTIDYLLKEIEIEIDAIRLKIPVAWLLSKDNDDIIIGREIIFDHFNIEFRQKEEKIIFTPA